MMNKREALAFIAAGKVLIGGPRSDRPGQVVEYLPRGDDAAHHPDFYAWHVVGRPDYDRLNVLELEVRDD